MTAPKPRATRVPRSKTSARTAGADATVAVRILNAGDTSRAICPHCAAMRAIVYRYRSVDLEQTHVTVQHVLVGVCTGCDATVTLPAQSIPRIREARERDSREYNIRVPLELEDRLNVMAASRGWRAEPFKGALCRYALSRVIADARFAAQVWTNARSDAAGGTPGGRVKFRAVASLPAAATAAANDAGVGDLSAMIRGAFLTVDAHLRDPGQRAAMEHDLRLIALGSGA